LNEEADYSSPFVFTSQVTLIPYTEACQNYFIFQNYKQP